MHGGPPLNINQVSPNSGHFAREGPARGIWLGMKLEFLSLFTHNNLNCCLNNANYDIIAMILYKLRQLKLSVMTGTDDLPVTGADIHTTGVTVTGTAVS